MATRNSGEQEQPKWTPFLTKLLANLIVDQVLKGNRVNSSFYNKAWNSITDEFFKRSGFKWDKEHLKNRFAVLRRQYALVKSLLARDDFVFNESTSSIIATDVAWDQYVKEYPDAEAIRSDGCPIYKQLSQIFAEDSMTTNGKHERTRPYFTRPRPEEPVLLPQELSSESDDDDAAVCPSTTTKRKRRSRGVEAAIANAIFEMAAASKLQTDALTQLSSRFSLAECIRELDRINALAENVYFAALEFFNSPSARETFLSLKSDMRLPWLQWKCNAASPTTAQT